VGIRKIVRVRASASDEGLWRERGCAAPQQTGGGVGKRGTEKRKDTDTAKDRQSRESA